MNCFQDTIKYRKGLSLGSNHFGIGFGTFRNYTGIRFSLLDKDSADNAISINIAQYTQCKNTNGTEISLIFADCNNLNGIGFGGLGTNIDDRANGLLLTGLLAAFGDMNGVVISGGFILSDSNLRGLAVCGIDNTSNIERGVTITGLIHIADSISTGLIIAGLVQELNLLQGISIAPINIAVETRGVQFGIFNKTEGMCGLQIGLLNTITRKKHFKRLPLINFCFRKE